MDGIEQQVNDTGKDGLDSSEGQWSDTGEDGLDIGGDDPSRNHLPESLYEDIPNNATAQCFVGFFRADGTNSSDGQETGFTLRSTEFPFLFNLLKACGV